MIGPGGLRKGMTVELDGLLYQVLEYQPFRMAQRTAMVRIKLRDLRGGHTLERTLQPSDKLYRVLLDRRPIQYIYREDDVYYFMDSENFEQTALNRSRLGEAPHYLKEGLELTLLSYKGEALGVEIPNSVELKIVETGPGFRGDTAQSGIKPAKLETGITVQVPLFINQGDVVRVDTRTGLYLERVSGS